MDERELYLLLAQFLAASPLARTAAALEEELADQGLLGVHVDWRGGETRLTLAGASGCLPDLWKAGNAHAPHLVNLLTAYLALSGGGSNGEAAGGSLLAPVPPSLAPRLAPQTGEERRLRGGLDAAQRRAGAAQRFQLLKEFRLGTVALVTARADLRAAHRDLATLKALGADLAAAAPAAAVPIEAAPAAAVPIEANSAPGLPYDVVFTEDRLGLTIIPDPNLGLPVVTAVAFKRAWPRVGDRIAHVCGFQLSGRPNAQQRAIQLISSAPRPVVVGFVTTGPSATAAAALLPPETAAATAARRQANEVRRRQASLLAEAAALTKAVGDLEAKQSRALAQTAEKPAAGLAAPRLKLSAGPGTDAAETPSSLVGEGCRLGSAVHGLRSLLGERGAARPLPSLPRLLAARAVTGNSPRARRAAAAAAGALSAGPLPSWAGSCSAGAGAADSKALFARYRPCKVLNGHGVSEVYCVAFDATGKFVVTGADDALVKVLNNKSKKVQHSKACCATTRHPSYYRLQYHLLTSILFVLL